MELAALQKAWPAMVGEQVAGHCRPVLLRDGCLTVSTDHPAWASELRLLQGEVLERTRAVAPSVQRLNVHVSSRP